MSIYNREGLVSRTPRIQMPDIFISLHWPRTQISERLLAGRTLDTQPRQVKEKIKQYWVYHI